MAHTNATASDVQDLLDTDLTTSEIDPFLTAAQRFVTDQLESEDIENATLTEIEKYLAAGIVTLRDPRLVSAQIDDVQESYQRETGSNEYFEIAAMLDPTGKVQARFIDKKQPVKWHVSDGLEP